VLRARDARSPHLEEATLRLEVASGEIDQAGYGIQDFEAVRVWLPHQSTQEKLHEFSPRMKFDRTALISKDGVAPPR